MRGYGFDFGDHLNADDIARTLGPPTVENNRRAQEIVREKRDQALAEYRDYSWESVMSHPTHLEHLVAARRAGYEVELLYVATEHPLVNVGRVADRVVIGEHDVPRGKILSRYTKSIAQLPRAMLISHRARVFDNSYRDADSYRLIATRRGEYFEAEPPNKLPQWFRPVLDYMEHHQA